MLNKKSGQFHLVQAITDQILLIFSPNSETQKVFRTWHISQKENALYEWERITK